MISSSVKISVSSHFSPILRHTQHCGSEHPPAKGCSGTFSPPLLESKLFPSPRVSGSGSHSWPIIPGPGTTASTLIPHTSSEDRKTQLPAVKCQKQRQTSKAAKHEEFLFPSNYHFQEIMQTQVLFKHISPLTPKRPETIAPTTITDFTISDT